jgi:hypothetical protein
MIISPLLHIHLSPPHTCAITLIKQHIIITLSSVRGFISYPALDWSRSKSSIGFRHMLTSRKFLGYVSLHSVIIFSQLNFQDPNRYFVNTFRKMYTSLQIFMIKYCLYIRCIIFMGSTILSPILPGKYKKCN